VTRLTMILGVCLLAGVGCQKQKQTSTDESTGLLQPDKSRGSARSARSPRSQSLSAGERATLLQLARRSLVASVTSTWPRALTDGLSIGPRLKRKQGAFVTLTKKGRLRGCIGTILPRLPLYQAVIKNAQNAALNDRRFEQVTVGELTRIKIEISALSVPHRLGSYRDIVLGKHGIILRRGSGSATYLPHVATQQKWDLPTTLRHLSQKAGLGPNGWKDPKTLFHAYTAEVWSEGG
jgi:AmmeMemoRadiSam system protein A